MNNLDRIYTDDPTAFAKEYLGYLAQVLAGIDTAAIGRFIQTLLNARERGATIYFVGNGGSAATASHFANDLAIGTNSYRKPFRAISLTDNQAIITAVGNDFGYDEVFVRQLRVVGRSGDVVVGISASGNSENLVRTFAHAKSVGIETIALTAFDGGRMRTMADQCIHVPTAPKEYGPAEDAHMILDHLVGAFLIRWVMNEGRT